MGFFDFLFGKDDKTTTGLDPASQRHVDAMRGMAQQGATMASTAPGSFFTGPITQAQIQAAMNPYLQNVVSATQGEFDFLRGMALRDANAQAARAGAFGGSRHGVMAGARLGELDRAQASTIANLMQGGYQQALQFAEHQRMLQQQRMQEPLFRAQFGVNLMNLGLGPTGTEVRQQGGGLF